MADWRAACLEREEDRALATRTSFGVSMMTLARKVCAGMFVSTFLFALTFASALSIGVISTVISAVFSAAFSTTASAEEAFSAETGVVSFSGLSGFPAIIGLPAAKPDGPAGVPAFPGVPAAKPTNPATASLTTASPAKIVTDTDSQDSFSRGLSLGEAFAAAEPQSSDRQSSAATARQGGWALAGLVKAARAQYERQGGDLGANGAFTLEQTLGEVMTDMAWRQDAAQALYRIYSRQEANSGGLFD